MAQVCIALRCFDLRVAENPLDLIEGAARVDQKAGE